jgi:hypothetical protein
MSTQALRAAVIQAAVSDAAFRAELEQDAVKAIQARFGVQSYSIQPIFEKEDELPFLIPDKTEQLVRSLERSVKDMGDRKPTRGQFEALLVLRAWNDAAFMAQLQSDARATLSAELARYDSRVPERKGVRVHVEQPGQCLIVIPRPAQASASEELSETELEAVAGGEGIVAIAVVTVVGGVVATTTGVIVNEWVCKSTVDQQAN